ncbi:glycosyltransferase family protein [Geminicoccus roseus]|uniref:hypothetical protein n=1 Tax=Geminicoccus roseus TaxID=404900 RepID=UPI0004221FED|nr:hypothetical protein [Geminicoccus roseus]
MISWRTGPAVPLFLFLFCCALYAINLDKAPHFDELYHVLAARGYNATGNFAIAEGVYTRAWPFTRAVAALFSIFGEHLWVARLPSVLCIALMVTVLFIWMRREAGLLVAVIGAGLFAVSPFAVDIAQFARFYGIHGLAFLVGSLLTYDLVTRPRGVGPVAVRGALAIAAFLVAIVFQVTTFIGIAALGLWAVLYLLVPWLARPEVTASRRLAVIAGLILLAAIALAAAAASGKLSYALALYRSTALWAESNANDVTFYHVWMILYYPTFWTLLPVLLVVALVAHPRITFFAITVFGIAFVLHSFAGAKDLRYIFYATPFLFVVWGVGLAAVLARAVRYFRDHSGVVLARLLPGRRVAGLVSAALVMAVIWLVAANAASIRTVLMLADITIPPERPAPQWDLAKPILDPLIAGSDVVVVSSELEALYFLGSYDVLISRSRMGERAGAMGRAEAPEFSRDTRTGRPVISTPGSVEELMACYPRGIIITSIYRWRHGPMLSNEVADLIIQRATPVELPKASRVMAFTWDNEPTADPAGCPAVRAPAEAATS